MSLLLSIALTLEVGMDPTRCLVFEQVDKNACLSFPLLKSSSSSKIQLSGPSSLQLSPNALAVVSQCPSECVWTFKCCHTTSFFIIHHLACSISDCSVSASLAFLPGDHEPHISKTRPCALLLPSHGNGEPPESSYGALLPQLLCVGASRYRHCLTIPLPKPLEMKFYAV